MLHNTREYGLGLGLRKSLKNKILDYIKQGGTCINWLEFVPENYIRRGGKTQEDLEEVLDSGIQLIPHSVSLSIGSADQDYDLALIKDLQSLFARIKAPWFSDHLSCSRIRNFYVQELLPLPRTQETIDIVSDNIKFLQDQFQIPFLLENPSYYSKILEPEFSEADFINKILEKSSCHLLLDVNNIYVNAINHGDYKPSDFLDELDLSKVVQVHIAGHLDNYESKSTKKILKILDTHGESVIDEVYEILDSLLAKTKANAIVLERDSDFSDFENLLGELERINQICKKHQ